MGEIRQLLAFFQSSCETRVLCWHTITMYPLPEATTVDGDQVPEGRVSLHLRMHRHILFYYRTSLRQSRVNVPDLAQTHRYELK